LPWARTPVDLTYVSWTTLGFRLFVRAMPRPKLALALLRVAWRFRARRWFARPPFLPVPDARYLRWRMYTAYRDADALPPVEDVERYALWASRP
jgi:hypothetical protein